MTVHCPNKNDHMPHRPCSRCQMPQYLADNGTWTHCNATAEKICGVSATHAAELVRQYDQQTGPRQGDPFDPDVWAWAAANLLRTLGGNQ